MTVEPLGKALGAVDGTYELAFERNYKFTPADVWAALTEPSRIGAWLAFADVDLKVGGRFVLKEPCHVAGKIVRLQLPTVLAWTWPHPAHPDSVVTWDVKPEDGLCTLRLVQDHLRPEDLIGIATGWHTHLEGLPGAIVGQHTAFSKARAAALASLYRASLR